MVFLKEVNMYRRPAWKAKVYRQVRETACDIRVRFVSCKVPQRTDWGW